MKVAAEWYFCLLFHCGFVFSHRHFSVCKIRALTIGYSRSSRHWLNILVNSSTSSFIGSISIAADFRLLKKDLSLMNATRTDNVHTVTHNPKVLHSNRHSISLQTEETENMLIQKMEMDTSRQKRDVNEAEDLAVLMEGENPESKARIIELISTDFASGGFSDPVVSRKSDTWSDRLGPKMGVMVRNLYSDMNAQSVDTAKDELDMVGYLLFIVHHIFCFSSFATPPPPPSRIFHSSYGI